MMECLILHGPNLNMLGNREPSIYGHHTLSDINEILSREGEKLGVNVTSRQSNHEGELVSYIQTSAAEYSGIVINAAAYTHTSIAIRDALLSASIPFVEVHMTNIAKREVFRQKSLLSDIAIGSVVGFGWRSYLYGLQSLVDYLNEGTHE